MLAYNKRKDQEGDTLVRQNLLERGVPDSFTRDLIATRKNELRAFATALRNESLHHFVKTSDGDESFDNLIRLAVNDYGVGQRQIAEATDVNVATVSRWVAGTSRAPRLSRPTILVAIATLVEHDIEVEG